MTPPARNMPSTAPQNGYYHQAPPGAPYQMPPPPYHSGPIPADYSGPRSVDYSGPRPADYSRQRPADYSGQRPVDYSGPRPVDYSGPRPADYSGPRPGDYSGPRPVDYSGQRPADYSGPRPADYSGQRPADYSGPRPTDCQFPKETAPVPTDAPDAGITLNSKPDIRDLVYLEKNNEKLQLIVRIAARWETLALHLGIEWYVISIISRDKSKCEDACIDMFQRWLGGEGCGPRTWAGIVSALEKMEENMIAHLVRELLQEQ